MNNYNYIVMRQKTVFHYILGRDFEGEVCPPVARNVCPMKDGKKLFSEAETHAASVMMSRGGVGGAVVHERECSAGSSTWPGPYREGHHTAHRRSETSPTRAERRTAQLNSAASQSARRTCLSPPGTCERSSCPTNGPRGWTGVVPTRTAPARPGRETHRPRRRLASR